jgi:alpha-mannosidase
MTTVILFKKNNHSIHLISEWYQTCCNYELINDKLEDESNLFKDHRHDQSVFSMLVHKYGSIVLPDETYFYPNWEDGKLYPFLARRIKY